MPLRRAKGNMYEWVTHVWSPMVGCSHQCRYCYVRNYRVLPEVPVLNESDFPDLGAGRTIFVGHMCDMFCAASRSDDVARVLAHCRRFANEYVFQTKNPRRLLQLCHAGELPTARIVGTTIETNREDLSGSLSLAPSPFDRSNALSCLPGRRFVTIEPILDFDPDLLVALIAGAMPEFVNIGADSKGHGLPEPSGEKVLELVRLLGVAGITIRKKVNLGRLTGGALP